MRLSIAFARSTFIAIPNERQVKSLIDDLVTKRGVVSGRLALLRGSTETQPLLLDLKNKSPPPRKRSRVVPRVRPTPSRPPDSFASARLPRVRPTPSRPPDYPASARLPRVHPTPPRPPDSPSSARLPRSAPETLTGRPLVRPTPPRPPDSPAPPAPRKRSRVAPGPRSSSSARGGSFPSIGRSLNSLEAQR